MDKRKLQQWCDAAGNKPLMLGYGSLMSRDSRQTYSGIFHEGILVNVSGYCRGWITRSIAEQQTYVGAVAEHGASLNAQLIPVNLDPALADREKDYRFEKVPARQITSAFSGSLHEALVNWLQQRPVYICRTLGSETAEASYPIHQSYVDTCMAGCMEAGGVEAAERFVQQTAHWNAHLINDRAAPKYPRSAKISHTVQQSIDKILRAVL